MNSIGKRNWVGKLQVGATGLAVLLWAGAASAQTGNTGAATGNAGAGTAQNGAGAGAGSAAGTRGNGGYHANGRYGASANGGYGTTGRNGAGNGAYAGTGTAAGANGAAATGNGNGNGDAAGNGYGNRNVAGNGYGNGNGNTTGNGYGNRNTARNGNGNGNMSNGNGNMMSNGNGNGNMAGNQGNAGYLSSGFNAAVPQYWVADASIFINSAVATANVLQHEQGLKVEDGRVFSNQGDYLANCVGRATNDLNGLLNNAVKTDPNAVPGIRATLAQLEAATAQTQTFAHAASNADLGPTYFVTVSSALGHLRTAANDLHSVAGDFGAQGFAIASNNGGGNGNGGNGNGGNGNGGNGNGGNNNGGNNNTASLH